MAQSLIFAPLGAFGAPISVECGEIREGAGFVFQDLVPGAHPGYRCRAMPRDIMNL